MRSAVRGSRPISTKLLIGMVQNPCGCVGFTDVAVHQDTERSSLRQPVREALAKMTIIPAQRLKGAAPEMARKGRVQEWDADGDVVPGVIPGAP